MKLRDELLNMSVYEKITFEKVKKIARRFYKTRLFRASDIWCMNYIKKYGLEHLVELPSRLQ